MNSSDNQTPSIRNTIARRLYRYRRRLHYTILAAGLLLMIILVFLCNLFTKDREFSDAENRSLQQLPAFTLQTVTDGTWNDEMLDYYSDQFFLRDKWISLNLNADRIAGRKDENGVMIGKDGYLLSYPDTPSENAISDMADAISTFASDHEELSVHLMVVPSASQILADKLPKNAPVHDQLADINVLYDACSSNVICLDAASPLQASATDYIYYKTDHHWTSLGAYNTFSATAQELGIESPITDYNIYPVTTEFEGTLSSKIGSHRTKDTITVYEPLGTDVHYIVTNPADGTSKTSVYDISKLSEKSKYNVFFGDNYPLLQIQTTANTGKTLMVFKDSYANSFVPFLLPYYSKIIMIDPRYYYDDLGTCLNSSNVTDVLFLFSADTLLTDDSTIGVLESAK